MKKFSLVALLTLLAVPHLFGAATEWKTNPHGKVRLIAPYNVAPRDGVITLGVQFIPEPGWLLYWKQSGEAGIPPTFDFKGSRGMKDAQTMWPRPKKFVLAGDITEYGYDEEVVYPIQAKAVAGKTLQIKLDMTYLTCQESCVPYRYQFALDVPQGAAPQSDPATAVLVENALTQVPAESDAEVLASLKMKAHDLGGRLGWMLLIALVGGLLLNVMPCVLPVLAIKLFGLLQHGGQERRVVVRDSLASAAGIIFSFLIGGALLVLARQAGKAVGWGVQFQNPGFVIFLIVLVMVFALNLWGVFEIPLPRFISHVGSFNSEDEGPLSYFVSGMFATLLATPCSAPFLGTAMGFALAQSSPVIMLIFLFAGVGLAFPYFSLAVFPQTLQWLPKPGDWMIRLKRFFALLLVATAVWLGWVLKQQLMPAPQTHASKLIEWMTFQESEIPKLNAAGKPVFVDVTADWCVTCKVNERLVLETPEIAGAFKKRAVVMMKADWTQQDAAIGKYLAKHGRAGIPFYVLYPPHRKPILLSEFLTKNQVLSTLRALDTAE